MITFTETDFKLTQVKRESKLFNLVTRNKYHVYGTRQTENTPVLIEYNGNKLGQEFFKNLSALIEFLKSNGIDVGYYAESERNSVDIGLRRDLRAFVNQNGKPMLASAVLSTIVYCLEGRIDLDELKKYKLKVIPTLTPVPETMVDAEGNA